MATPYRKAALLYRVEPALPLEGRFILRHVAAMTADPNGLWSRSPHRHPTFQRLGGAQMPAEPSTRVAVTVTFLRQTSPPGARANVSFPPGYGLARIAKPSVALYRQLYNGVGGPYVWWLRRMMPDAQIAALLASPGVSIHVLSQGDEPAGFYELDAGQAGVVNISYFGLMPAAIGRGLGARLLQATIDSAWASEPRLVTVNTCTADHPRALPNYLAAGFTPVRSAREVWDVPDALGLVIPDHLRV